MESEEFKERKAPYAPVSAVEEFLDKMAKVAVPPRVDRAFLQKLNIARGNEWALLSALKFLGVINQQGVPTPAYRRLLSTETQRETLRSLVENGYAQLFEIGGPDMSTTDLVNYFRVASSPSQARNAARFFRAVSELAGLDGPAAPERLPQAASTRPAGQPVSVAPRASDTQQFLAEAKVRLLDKLPAPRPEWDAADYAAVCQTFLEMLRHLDV